MTEVIFSLVTLKPSFSAEDAACFNIDSRTTEQLCCKESNIIPDIPSSVKVCSSFSTEGYK
jgi:hypothetical protein